MRPVPVPSALAATMLGSLLSLACTTAPAAADRSAESVFGEAREYTVRIRATLERPFIEDDAGAWSGSGFLVDSERGWILTNAHVAGLSPTTLQVAFAGGEYMPARRIYVDTFSDIAVIAVSGPTGGRKPARMQCEELARVGEALGVFGHPRGLPFTGTRGIVSGRTDQFGPHYIQTDATVDHGNSGGPVMRLRDGRVIGLATAGVGDPKNAGSNFVTPAREACRILELLRRGQRAEPPRMPFSLLVDEDGRHTLEVGATHDPERWPFQPGDRLLAVEGEAGPIELENLSDLVTALRGRTGTVRIAVQRGDRTTALAVSPRLQPSALERRGVSIDGVLIGASDLADSTTLKLPSGLIVHSVEEGSNASSLRIDGGDIVESVDGRSFTAPGDLLAYLRGRAQPGPVRLVLRRWSAGARIFDYHVRELPGDDIEEIGEGVEVASDGE